MRITRLPAIGSFGIHSYLSRLLDELVSDFTEVGLEVGTKFGATDIYEKDKKIYFETELPGATKDDIELKVEDDKLLISGTIKRSEEVKDENYFRIGRRYGQFQRVFPLPSQVGDHKKISAKFKDGILQVVVPLRDSIKEKAAAIDIKIE
ncbi:Hsp20/alpha crystallin family protein [Candidatus Acetothermia bacterium]|jgi:HSP20 family protein|nr:Hsp20/alpha crystallin family protein [Candidatus Acetothermia bacterium]MCI2427539.1 Hsp20/alpha crystallin family protein [Candidatus Acetothermia bacterium]MCI2428034.1 Hsp20/alpha crystallin family protein [Candidatus Acetothermia bacterium]